MDGAGTSASELLAGADAARADGDLAGFRDGLVRSFRAAREAGDVELMAAVALQLPTGQEFGLHPGQLPALLHEAYVATPGPSTRARLAAALTRAWVYGGDAARAAPFAAAAQELAALDSDPRVVADALEAALLVNWGPDEFPERLRLAARLSDTAAHLTDTEARLSAELWRLTTAWECLDVVAVQRQLRALDLLAGETGSARVRFFAAARRAMHALVVGDLEEAGRLTGLTKKIGTDLAEPDVQAVLHSLTAGLAHQTDDVPVLRAEAEAFEEFGAANGVGSILAEAAVWWCFVGEDERALGLIRQVAGADVAEIPRDVDFLLTVSSLVGVAAALGEQELAGAGARLLGPYAGRAVLNAGAVTFHGVVDDYMFRAARSTGSPDAERWRRAAANCYRRIGAPWWERQVRGPAPSAPGAARVLHCHPHEDIWTVGPADATYALVDLRGLHHLRELLRHPGTDIDAATLVDVAAGHPGAGVRQPDLGPVLDARAAAAYRRRLTELADEIDEARSWNDPTRLEHAESEREALLAELGAATGLAGRRRRPGSTDERARVAVRKAVATALERVARHDPTTARYLRETVHTGLSCRYEPDPARPVTWVLDAPAS